MFGVGVTRICSTTGVQTGTGVQVGSGVGVQVGSGVQVGASLVVDSIPSVHARTTERAAVNPTPMAMAYVLRRSAYASSPRIRVRLTLNLVRAIACRTMQHNVPAPRRTKPSPLPTVNPFDVNQGPDAVISSIPSEDEHEQC